MVTVAPESAASMHGPKPASYWRSSSWADSGPVKATLETCPSSIRVTDTSAAPVIVCLASSATRLRTSDSCCSLSMILLSSAKAARASSGGSAPPVWKVDMGESRSRGRTAGFGLATVLEGGAVGRSRAKSRDENRRPRCCAHREPVVGNGANSPHAWDRLLEDDATRRSRALADLDGRDRAHSSQCTAAGTGWIVDAAATPLQ